MKYYILCILFLLLLVYYCAFREIPLQFQLLEDHPTISIVQAYFINMDTSVARRECFLATYDGPPIARVPGVLVDEGVDTGKIGRGAFGCAMAHANILRSIGDSVDGWYLVCEDDARGDFHGVMDNPIVCNIAARTDKQFINLTYEPTRYSYDLNVVHEGTVAYLVQPTCAKLLSMRIVDNIRKYPCDYVTQLYLDRKGNSMGCHVNLIGYEGLDSDIAVLGR